MIEVRAGITGNIPLSVGDSGAYHYAGTTKGIFCQGKNRRFSLLPGSDGETWNFYHFGQRLYVAHETGVFELQGLQLRKLIGQAGVHCLCGVKDHPDRLLMGTYNDGIWLMEKKGAVWVKRKIKGFEEESHFMELDEDGNCWTGHYKKGIFKLHLNERMDSVVVGRTVYDDKNGLPSKSGNRLQRGKNGELIASTANGIYRYDKDKDRFVPHQAFRQALPEGWNIRAVAEDQEGDVYFRGGPPLYSGMAGLLRRQPDGSFKVGPGAIL